MPPLSVPPVANALSSLYVAAFALSILSQGSLAHGRILASFPLIQPLISYPFPLPPTLGHGIYPSLPSPYLAYLSVAEGEARVLDIPAVFMPLNCDLHTHWQL